MKICFSAVLLSLALLANPLQAEQKKTLGNWDLHYIAFDSTLLDVKVAQQYGIERSTYNALLNISVLNKSDQKSQQVQLTGSARDLFSKEKTLTFREVKEGDAVYYLATFPVRNEEHLSFNIKVQQGNQSQVLQFSQTFYTD